MIIRETQRRNDPTSHNGLAEASEVSKCFKTGEYWTHEHTGVRHDP